MGLTGISEFTFGFAFLHEQTARYFAGLTAVPILPSLQQEVHGGWDARLPINGVANYYQFKLSDRLHGRNAKYFREEPFYTAPYYRIAMHRRNDNQQHQKLRELCANFPETYYVAPELDDVDLFNEAFVRSEIFDNSRLIPLNQCRDYHDGEQHYITYQSGNPNWIEHSEPIKHEWSYSGKNLDELFASQKSRMIGVDEDFAKDLFRRQTESTTKAIEFGRKYLQDRDLKRLDEPHEKTRTGYLRAASDQAMTFFGAILVIVGEPQ